MIPFYSTIKYLETRNKNKKINNIKNLKRECKTSEITSIKLDEKIEKQKKIKLNKFLTKVIGYEGKRNYELEKIRFNNLWKEKKNYIEKPFSTWRTIKERNKNNNKLTKRINTSYQEIKTQKLKEKYNNSIDIDVIKTKKSISSERMNKFYENQKKWVKTVADKKNNKKREILQINQNLLEQYFHPKTNRNYNKTKYRNEKTLDQLNQKYELDFIKKKYNQNKHIYVYKPKNNNKKYNRISPKYDKYSIKKINYKNSVVAKKEKFLKDNKKANIKKVNNNINKNLYPRYKLSMYIENNKNNKIQKIKSPSKVNNLNLLLKNINNKAQLINKNNIYYINVNEKMSCDTFVNKIIYKRHNSAIDNIIFQNIENSENTKKFKNISIG